MFGEFCIFFFTKRKLPRRGNKCLFFLLFFFFRERRGIGLESSRVESKESKNVGAVARARAWYASVAFVSLGDCGGSFYERSRRRRTRPEALNLRIFRKTSRYATTMWVSAQVHCVRLLVLYRQLPAGPEISAARKIKYRAPLFPAIHCRGTIDLTCDDSATYRNLRTGHAKNTLHTDARTEFFRNFTILYPCRRSFSNVLDSSMQLVTSSTNRAYVISPFGLSPSYREASWKISRKYLDYRREMSV